MSRRRALRNASREGQEPRGAGGCRRGQKPALAGPRGLLVAAGDVGQSNYGLAAERASRARDLVTGALAAPGFTMDLGAVRDMLDSAIGKIGAEDRDAGAVLTRAATELGRLLEQAGQA